MVRKLLLTPTISIFQPKVDLEEVRLIADEILNVAKPDDVLKFFGAKIENCEEDLLIKQ